MSGDQIDNNENNEKNETDLVKESEGPKDAEYVKIKLVGERQQEIFFKLKRSTKLLKLMEYYSKQVGVGVVSLKFLIDGKRIVEDDTPETLDLNDNDQIEVFYSQTGGNTEKIKEPGIKRC